MSFNFLKIVNKDSRLVAKLLTCWGALFVACFAIFVAIPRAWFYTLVWNQEERHRQKYHEWFCGWCRRISSHIPLATVAWHNNHNEQFEKPAMIIANHQSHLDLITLIGLHPRLVIMTNQWVWNFPLYAPVIRYLEYYPSAEGFEGSEEHMSELVKRGYSILIFPEGTRSANCNILKFKRGAFYLAQQLKLDIVPVYLSGCGAVLPKTDFCLHRGHIDIEIGKRVEFEDNSMGETYGERTRMWHKHYLNKFCTTTQ